MAFNTDKTPHEVLEALQRIEREISPESHRNSSGGYADRVIDIDIVAIDRLEISDERLTIPHPHLASRRFFLEPLQELAPGWTHPATGLDAATMLCTLEDKK